MPTKRRKASSRRQRQPGPRSHRSAVDISIEASVLEDLLLEYTEGVAPEEAERLLDEVLVGANPQEPLEGFLLEGLLAEADDVVASLETPLDAEMWGSELLGMLRLMGIDTHEVDELVASAIVPMAEDAGTRAALALLVVLSGVGGPKSARAAKAARQKLSAAGVPEPAWATGLATPTVGRCWAYRDVFGEQESIHATFRYGRSEHVLCVLVDHGLGGGVKDSYVTTHVRRLRRQMTDLASDDPVMVMGELDITEAATKLRQALAAPPCPRAPDQIRDSALTAALVHSRVAHMSASVASAPDSASSGRTNLSSASSNTSPTAVSAAGIWQIKITLSRTKPPIWRRLEVPGDLDLGTLHRAIQGAFGWWDSHLHVFETGVGRFGVPDRELGFRNERSITLSDVAPRTGDRFTYTYDFGDDWEHVIVVEKLVPRATGTRYPRCTDGRRACPPEDCGGVWGYHEMLRAGTETGCEEHPDVGSWIQDMIPNGFDPEKFEVSEVNARLAGVG